jgi:DNA-binding NtrC family response regulator
MSNQNETRILLVDDEPMVLSSIQVFLQLETDYQVLTFSSPARALENLEKNRIDLAISDYLMPEMDGITFLGKVKEKWPIAPRVLLTGYADKENAIKAINDVGLYHYIEKPWNNDDLLLVIRNAVERSLLLRQLEENIEEIEKAHSELAQIQRRTLRLFQ